MKILEKNEVGIQSCVGMCGLDWVTQPRWIILFSVGEQTPGEVVNIDQNFLGKRVCSLLGHVVT